MFSKELNKLTGTTWYVVKAQIHAGGRGKGVVTETGSHGVVLAKGIDKVEEIAVRMNSRRQVLITNNLVVGKWLSFKVSN